MVYVDYDLVIGDDLRVTAASGGDLAVGELKLDKNEIQETMQRIEDEKMDRDLIRNVGTKLYNALFTADIKKHFNEVKARSGKNPLRIRLMIESPEISAYPWEALYENGDYMACLKDRSLIRVIPTGKKAEWKFDETLKMLIICSNPSDPRFVHVPGEDEIELIEAPLKERNAKLSIIRKATISNIMAELKNAEQKKEEFNIIHFMGHGWFKDDKGYLALRNDDASLDPADHERIRGMFRNSTSLGLVVLNACQGADTSTSKAFTGLCPELIKMGVPYVIAMRSSISNQTAKLFSKEFYENLANMPIEENIQMVRQRIYVESPTDFIIPVLYMSSEVKQIKHNKLYDIIIERSEKVLKELEEDTDFWLSVLDLNKTLASYTSDYKDMLKIKDLTDELNNLIATTADLKQKREQVEKSKDEWIKYSIKMWLNYQEITRKVKEIRTSISKVEDSRRSDSPANWTTQFLDTYYVVIKAATRLDDTIYRMKSDFENLNCEKIKGSFSLQSLKLEPISNKIKELNNLNGKLPKNLKEKLSTIDTSINRLSEVYNSNSENKIIDPYKAAQEVCKTHKKLQEDIKLLYEDVIKRVKE